MMHMVKALKGISGVKGIKGVRGMGTRTATRMRMSGRFVILIVLLMLTLMSVGPCFANPGPIVSTGGRLEDVSPVPLNDLIEKSKDYDQKEVIITGEALLEGLERTDGVWVNIHDGSNALGLFLSHEDVNRIKGFGDYHKKGDTLVARARFNRACQVHGGDLDLHAIEILSITPGAPTPRPVDPIRVGMAIVILGTGLSLLYFYLKGGKEKKGNL